MKVTVRDKDLENCDKCVNSGICKYEEMARKFEKSLRDFENDFYDSWYEGARVPDGNAYVIGSDVYCHKFYMKKQYRKQIESNNDRKEKELS